MRFKNGGYGGAGGGVPHRNHAVIPAVRRDDEFFIIGDANGSNWVGVALKKALLTELVIKYDGGVCSAVQEALAVRGGQINDAPEQIFAEAKDP